MAASLCTQSAPCGSITDLRAKGKLCGRKFPGLETESDFFLSRNLMQNMRLAFAVPEISQNNIDKRKYKIIFALSAEKNFALAGG
jgi:hypothetical protein